jgi:hypothetical protein
MTGLAWSTPVNTDAPTTLVPASPVTVTSAEPALGATRVKT